MPAQTLDLREMPAPQRHPTIHEAFDADGYSVEQRGEAEFVADLPKR
ncbi:MAG: hypothetical protein V5A39_03245 [Haloarculaceae archaeon]